MRDWMKLFESKSAALYPAVKVGGKKYVAKKPGDTHFTALELITDPATRGAAILDGDNRGFVNERGQWLTRAKAARYARDFDLYDDQSPAWSAWMRDSYELSSETPLKHQATISEARRMEVSSYGLPFPIWKAPTRTDLIALSSTHNLRGFYVDDSLYVWRAEDATHLCAAKGLRDAALAAIPTWWGGILWDDIWMFYVYNEASGEEIDEEWRSSRTQTVDLGNGTSMLCMDVSASLLRSTPQVRRMEAGVIKSKGDVI